MASAPKRVRTEPDPGAEDAVAQAVARLEQVQEELNKLNEEAAEAVLQVERSYNLKRAPLYKSRSEVISQIPYFWLRAMLNCPITSEYVSNEDQLILEHLKDVRVEETDDIKSGFSIYFDFEANDYFTNTTLYIKVDNTDAGQALSTSKVDWKPNRKPHTAGDKAAAGSKRSVLDADDVSFFDVFDVDTGVLTVDLAEMIKDELFPNALAFFTGEAVEADLESDEEEFEEGDEEDEQEDDDEGDDE